jgi:lipid-A-disaccharide synthase
VRHVGLPNLLLKRDLVPECLQDACTPVQLLDALRGVYESPERLRQMKSGFAQIHQALRQSAATRVGNRLSELITR